MFTNIREEDIRELLDRAIEERDEYLAFNDSDEESEDLDARIEELQMTLWDITR